MRGGIWPFSPAAPVSEEEAERIARKKRQEERAVKLPDGTALSTGATALKVASTVTLLAAVAGQAPLIGGVLSGVLKLSSAVLRAKAFSQRSKRYAHEMTADVKLTSALITLLVGLRNKVNLRFNTDSIKDAAADVNDQINSITNPSSGISALKDLARAETMLKELKEAMQDLKNNVTTAYIAVDLEMSSKGTSIKDIVHNGEDPEIKKAWKDYIDAQNPDAAVWQLEQQEEYKLAVAAAKKMQPAPKLDPQEAKTMPAAAPAVGGRRKSRRRRSRKGKTFRRKRQ
jgi:hypothetical protein